MASIGLCMIAKDEAHVIARCLDAVLPLIDFVLVEDTGSTDGTQKVVTDWLARHDLPGIVIEEPWRDFAYNRSHALAKLREFSQVDYALIIDADDQMIIGSGFDAAAFKANLQHDVLSVQLRQAGSRYSRPLICSNRMPFFFKGILHEYLQFPDGPVSRDDAEGFYIVSGREGARSLDPKKYEKDAATLERALLVETDPFLIARYRFYLAQSYRDFGARTEALANYLLRAELGFWSEEVYWSLYQAAKQQEALGASGEVVIGAFLKAAEAGPSRSEALHGAARYCRLQDRFEEAYQFARRALDIPFNEGGLFAETWIHDYGSLDELAISAYWTGRHELSAAACDRLLDGDLLPDEHRGRVLENRAFATDKLAATDASTEAGRFFQLLRSARASQDVGQDAALVIAAYEAASAADATRSEALHDAARYCRFKDRFQEAYLFATRGLAIAPPQDTPDSEAWIYRYGLLDELAVSAYWTERYDACVEACDRLLNEGRTPPDMRDRVLQNRGFALAKLQESKDSTTAWVPAAPIAGTEIMVAALRARLGPDLDRINLQINHPGSDDADPRPRVVWLHHDADQQWVQWCRDPHYVDKVDRFVFVSDWQRERYISVFGLSAERCVVMRHALDLDASVRAWRPGPIKRFAYTSTPFRGLSVLLDAWELFDQPDAELHVWSSMKIYVEDDRPYEHLYARARALPNVTYHGIAPNAELREALRTMDYLAYPCTFPETACLAVVEAMSAGCRVIAPSLGALPETTGGYAHIYPWEPQPGLHAERFARVLASEHAAAWAGRPELAIEQQKYCAQAYSWPRRVAEWRSLISAQPRRGRLPSSP